jgi:hypothetical protein
VCWSREPVRFAISCLFSFNLYILVIFTAYAPCGAGIEKSPLLSPLTRWGPSPPHPPAPGRITSDHPTSKVPLLSTVVLLVRVYRTGGNTWKGALPPPVHSGGHCYPGTFPWRPSPLAVKVQGKEETPYMYAFTSDYATAQRGT